MQNKNKLLVAAVFCAATFNPMTSAVAQPRVDHKLYTDVSKGGGIESVRYYGGSYGNHYRGYRDYGHHRHYGRNIGIGIGSAIVGGVLLSEAARAYDPADYGDGWDRCAETYRSFEPSTGMYTGYDGVRRICPYLN